MELEHRRALSDEGFIHGRFQIFHNEHLDYAVTAASRCRFLHVGVTQPDNIRLMEAKGAASHRNARIGNPLSYQERSEIIHEALVGAGLPETRFAIQAFPIENPACLTSVMPTYIIAYTTICDGWNLRKIALLEGLGYKIEVVRRRPSTRLTAATIRQMILDRDSRWQTLVPPSCAHYLRTLNIEQRLRDIQEGRGSEA